MSCVLARAASPALREELERGSVEEEEDGGDDDEEEEGEDKDDRIGGNGEEEEEEEGCAFSLLSLQPLGSDELASDAGSTSFAGFAESSLSDNGGGEDKGDEDMILRWLTG